MSVSVACPRVVETIKWGMPAFEHDGRFIGGMAAFKAHAVFYFWRGKRLKTLAKLKRSGAMGQLGRITTLDDLPSDRAFITVVKEASSPQV